MRGRPLPLRGLIFLWLLALALIGPVAWSKGTTVPCPPKGYDISELSPCKCRLTQEDYLQLWCSGGDLESLLKSMASVASWRGALPVDELVVEGGAVTGLPGRAFSPLRVRRLLMHRSGLERMSSAALLGLEGSLVELMLVEPRLRSLPADLLDMVPRLEALTIDVTDNQDGGSGEGDAFPGRPLSVPLLRALPALRYLRITAPTSSGLTGLLPPRDPSASVTLPALLSLSVHGGWVQRAGHPGVDDALWSALSFFAGCCGGVEELLLDGNGLRLGKERLRLDTMSAPRSGEISLRSLKVLDVSDNPLGMASDPSVDGGALSSIADEVPPQTQWLLDGAPAWVFPALTELRANRASLSVLPEGALQSLPRLERLSLEGNSMRSIGPDALYDLPSLLELRLRDNLLSEDSMPPPPYRRRLPWTLPALKGLDLSKNILRGGTSLRRLLSGSPSIRRLDLSDNAIDSLADDSFAASPLLEFVDLSGNPVLSLTSAPRRPPHLLSFLKPLSRLYELRISGAPTTPYGSSAHLPLEPRHRLGKHHRLMNVTAGDNSFPVLPPLPGVEVLVASGMGIRRLYRSASLHPPPFSNALLPRLTSLDLSGNDLTIVDPGAFAGVSSTLTAVDLSRNRLSGVLRLGPPLPMKSLRKLDVSENQLDAISVVTAASFPQLKVLNASGNVISSMEMGLPIVLGPSLEVADLSRNSIVFLPEDPLKPFVSLTELWLDGNKICSISGRPFDSTPRLRILSLRHNRLATLSPFTFRRLLSNSVPTVYSSTGHSSALRQHALLRLEGNPLSCSCRLLWLQEWLQEMEDEGAEDEEGMRQEIRCKDGTPLHQKRLSRKDCQRQHTTSALLNSRGDLSLADDLENRDDESSCKNDEEAKAQVSSPQELQASPLSSSSLQHQQPPSPEESEYFYDQYVDEIHPGGPVGNAGNSVLGNAHAEHSESITTTTTAEPLTTTTTEASNDYIPGDTPTIYAGTRPKNESFTVNKEGGTGNAGMSIFGIPIPSWNLSSLFGSGKKRAGGTAKVARVNGPSRGPVSGQGRRRGHPKVMADRNAIAPPKLESGFRPIFPGSGGFVPITGKISPAFVTNASQENRQPWPAPPSGKPIAISHLSAAILPSMNFSAGTETGDFPSVTANTLHSEHQKPSFPSVVKPLESLTTPNSPPKTETPKSNWQGHSRDKLPSPTEASAVVGSFSPASENRFANKWGGSRAIGTVERVELKKNVGIEVGSTGSTNRGLKSSVGKAIMVIDDSETDESYKSDGIRIGSTNGSQTIPEIITVKTGLMDDIGRSNVSVSVTPSPDSVANNPGAFPSSNQKENFPSVSLQTTSQSTHLTSKEHDSVPPASEANDIITEQFTLPTMWVGPTIPKETMKKSEELNSSRNDWEAETDVPPRGTKAPSGQSQGTLLSSYLLAPGGQARVTKVSKTTSSQHQQQYSSQYEGEYYPHASQASVDVEFHDIELHKQERTRGIGYTKWPSEDHGKRSRLPEWYYANYNATDKDVYRGPLEDIIVTEGYPEFPSSSSSLHPKSLLFCNLILLMTLNWTELLNPTR